MAKIQTIDMKNDGILVTLKISEEEYEFLKPKSREFLIIPIDEDTLDETLTTGKLGNSNRIMLPNKILKKYEIKKLLKKVSSKIFNSKGDKLLVIKLEESKVGMPVFKED
jgi:translation initiation factor 6 (eIF-6)